MKTNSEAALDTVWIIMTTYVIFTMQLGFAFLESGFCSKKNVVNVMMKNIVDVLVGCFTYWCLGYGLQFGIGSGSNQFFGYGNFFINQPKNETVLHFFFQASFASTAATIVSGAVAERFNFVAYILYSGFFFITYCVPAGWIWRENGFLNVSGVVDYSGSSVIHFLGGMAALVGAFMVKPRIGRYKDGSSSLGPKPGSPQNVLIGCMFLWWGFLIFNSGSTFGVSGDLWQLSSQAFLTTLMASCSGGITGLLYSKLQLGYFDIGLVGNGILTGLVSTTGCAPLITVFDAIYIGAIGALISCLIPKLMDKLQIDDPVGAVSVHGGGGFWGTIATSLSTTFDRKLPSTVELSKEQFGILKGGQMSFLWNQLWGLGCVSLWTIVISFVILFIIDYFYGIRMSEAEERLGADFWFHAVDSSDNLKERMEEAERLGLDILKQKQIYFGEITKRSSVAVIEVKL